MKITLSSSGGTRRTIPLAYELNKHSLLDKFYIPFYKKEGNDSYIINDGNMIITNEFQHYTRRLLEKLGANKTLTRYIYCDLFDEYVSKKVERGSNILFVESLMALKTLRKAKNLGMSVILDRTNSHILHQNELLQEEFDKFGMKYEPHKPTIEKSIKEYNETDYIAVLSSFVKKSFIDNGIDEKKLLLLPSGIETGYFKQADKEDNVFRIIFCGTTCIKKGVYYLLKAFKELNLKNSELWLIGGIHKDMSKIIGQFSGSYKDIGYVPKNELYRYFSQGSVFVLPSIEEGLAKVLMEAMACGLPLIATTNTGVSDLEINEKAGFEIPIRNIDKLKEKILYFYENQGICREMGKYGQKAVNERFKISDYCNRIIDKFRSIS